MERLSIRSELFHDEAAAILALQAEECTVKPRTVVVRAGQHSDFCILVGDGLVGRYDRVGNRQPQITALCIAGDMCDLHRLALPRHGWGYEALSPVKILRVPRLQLARLASDHPRIGLAFWRDTLADASILAKWAITVGRRGATERLAHLLCELGLRVEAAHLGRRTDFRLSLTQVQLADMLALTSVRVNFSLGSLQRDGVIARDRAHVRVLDLDRLIEIAEFEPGYLLLRRSEDPG